MIRGPALLTLLLAACVNRDVPSVACTDDQSCPFEQCCVQGLCVDPGPIGGCSTIDAAQSILSSAASTVVAGVTIDLTAQLRDMYGRPVPGVTPTVEASSACGSCNNVTLTEPASDDHGLIHITFSSRVAEKKTVIVSIGGTVTNSVVINVVPDVAVSAGFKAALTDTMMGDQLKGATVTLLDQFGNPEAKLASGTLGGDISVSLAPNAANVVLRGPSGVALPDDATPVTLTAKEVAVNNITVEHAAYGLELIATPPAGSGLAPSHSQAFNVLAARLTSSDPDPIEATTSATLTWSFDPPSTGAFFSDDTVGPLDVVSPYQLPVTGSELHVRLASKIASVGLDVEVAPIGGATDFTSPRVTSSAGPAIVTLGGFPDGDVLVAARFNIDIVLAGVDTKAVLPAGYEAMIARFDPTMTTLRWSVILYTVNEHSGGATITIRDSVVVSDDEVLVLAEATGVSVGWQFQSGGVKRCVSGGPAAAGPVQATIARINGTGNVTACAAIRDSLGGDVRASALAVTSQYDVVATRSTESVTVVTGAGIAVTAMTPLIQGDPSPGTTISIATATPDAGCPAEVGALIPFKDDLTLAAPTPIVTGIMFDPQALVVDADAATLLWGGGGCSSTKHLEQGAAGAVVTTGHLDGVLMHADFAAAAGTRLSLAWQSDDLATDIVTNVQALDGNSVAIAGSFAGTFNGVAGDAFVVPANLLNGFVGSITRGTLGALDWGYHIKSPFAVAPQALIAGPDRLVYGVVGKDSLTLVGSEHSVSDVDQTQALPVGMYLEMSRGGELRWSSPVLGPTSLVRPLLLPEGATMVSAVGTKGTLTLGPLDAHPLLQYDRVQPGVEPILGTLQPYDFTERDIVSD